MGKRADTLNNKHTYVVHAEANAICNWYHRGRGNDYKLYVTLFPCNECTKLIIQSGIKEVIYANPPKNWKDTYTASQLMLDQAGIPIRQYDGIRELNLDLTPYVS